MGVSVVDTMLKFVVVSLLIAGVFGGDEGKEKVVKVKNTYPATHNILGNLYNTKHGHAIHEYYGHGSDHGYDHGVHLTICLMPRSGFQSFFKVLTQISPCGDTFGWNILVRKKPFGGILGNSLPRTSFTRK